MVLGFPRPILCLALYYRSTADCSSIFSEPFSKKETVLSFFPLILVQCLDNAFLYLSFAQSCKLKTCRHRPFRNSTGNWDEFRIVVFDKERFHNAVEVQPRSQSSSAISDVTSSVKLVGKIRLGRLANNGKSKMAYLPGFMGKKRPPHFVAVR